MDLTKSRRSRKENKQKKDLAEDKDEALAIQSGVDVSKKSRHHGQPGSNSKHTTTSPESKHSSSARSRTTGSSRSPAASSSSSRTSIWSTAMLPSRPRSPKGVHSGGAVSSIRGQGAASRQKMSSPTRIALSQLKSSTKMLTILCMLSSVYNLE